MAKCNHKQAAAYASVIVLLSTVSLNLHSAPSRLIRRYSERNISSGPSQSALEMEELQRPCRSNMLDCFFDVNSGRWRDVDSIRSRRVLFLHIVSHQLPTDLLSVGSKKARTSNLYRSVDSAVLILTGKGVYTQLLQLMGGFQFAPPPDAIREFTHREATFMPMVRWYDEQDALEYFFQPVTPHLPRTYYSDQDIPVARCYNTTWPFDYAFWSGAVTTYHTLHLRLLRKYDFLFKVDLDIRFFKPLPSDTFLRRVSGCAFVHTALQAKTDCERGILDALQSFMLGANSTWNPDYTAEVRNLIEWDFQVFHGNFVGLSTNLLGHPKTLQLANYLYENFSVGYFENRWGDQAPMVALASFYLNTSDLASSDQVCDLTDLRELGFFQHSALFKTDSPFT